MDTTNSLLKPKNLASNNHNYALNGKIMLSSVIVFFMAIIIMVCFHTYARWLFKSCRRRRQSHLHLLSLSNATDPVGVTSQGLELSVLEALPTFAYSSKTHDPLPECSVCLSKFQENEKGRVLPNCRHVFHIRCIDMWFHSHSNCPLCRAPVQDNIKEISAETGVSALEPAGSERESCLKEEGEMGCSSSLSVSSIPRLECQRKPLELVGIVVEMPTRDRRFRNLVEAGMG